MTADDESNLYVGTGGRGVFTVGITPVTNGWYWNGDEQNFSLLTTLHTDMYGNVYASNAETPGMAFKNSTVNMGIMKYDGNKWTQIYSGHPPFYKYIGVNSFIVDSKNRIIATHAQKNTDDAANYCFTGLITIDNPFLNNEYYNSEGSLIAGPKEFVLVNTIDTERYFNCLSINPHEEKVFFIPTAINADREGKIYVSQSNTVTWKGAIVVLKDYTYKSTVNRNSFNINIYDYSENGNESGFDIVGEISTENNLANDGHYNFIDIDKSGNVWAVGLDKGEIDIFGLKKSVSNNDTFIFDNGDIKSLIYEQDIKPTGIPEAHRGLQAYLGGKIVKKVKKDLYSDIWIATTSGLYYYSEGKDVYANNTLYGNCRGLWRYFLPEVSINDIDFDSLNNVWIATDQYGLKMLYYNTAKYPTDTMTYGRGSREEIKYEEYREATSGILSNKILSVSVHRPSGKVFLGYQKGLQVFESGIRFAENVSEGYVYPVLLKGTGNVFFNTRSNGSLVNVYNLSGKLIFSKKLSDQKSGYTWNTRNRRGTLTESGVYLFKYQSASGKVKTGKFAIIR